MKQYLILLLFTCSFYACTSQKRTTPKDLTSELAKKYAIQFSLNDDKSEGTQLLDKLMADYDYVVLGEYHYSENIQLLTDKLLRLGSRHGYTDFVSENGKYTTYILNEISKSRNISEELEKYIIKNSHKFIHEGEEEYNYPIPFFSAKQEVNVLETLRDLNYHSIGVDQEFCHSTKMFINRLYDQKEISADKAKKAIRILDSLDIKDMERGFNMYKAILEDSTIMQTMRLYNNTAWKGLYNGWKRSMRIYTTGRHSPRVDLIREQFIEQMTPRFEKNEDLKMIVKLGGLHTPKGPTQWFGIYDIGEQVHEIAHEKNKKSLHILCNSRYWNDKDTIVDAIAKEKDDYENTFKLLGSKDKWTLIDLRKLRKDHQNKLFRIPEGPGYSYIKHVLTYNDILFITPTDNELIDF